MHFYPADQDGRSSSLVPEERITKSFFCLSFFCLYIIIRLDPLTCDYISPPCEALWSSTKKSLCRSFHLWKSLPVWSDIQTLTIQIMSILITCQRSLWWNDNADRRKSRSHIKWGRGERSTSDNDSRTWSARSSI